MRETYWQRKTFWEGFWEYSGRFFGDSRSSTTQSVPEEVLDAASCSAQFAGSHELWREYEDENILLKCNMPQGSLYVDLKQTASQEETKCVLAIQNGRVLTYLPGIWEDYVISVVAPKVDKEFRKK